MMFPRELRAAVALLMAWIAQLARDERIDAALLATRGDLAAYLRGDPEARVAQGWRSGHGGRTGSGAGRGAGGAGVRRRRPVGAGGAVGPAALPPGWGRRGGGGRVGPAPSFRRCALAPGRGAGRPHFVGAPWRRRGRSGPAPAVGPSPPAVGPSPPAVGPSPPADGRSPALLAFAAGPRSRRIAGAPGLVAGPRSQPGRDCGGSVSVPASRSGEGVVARGGRVGAGSGWFASPLRGFNRWWSRSVDAFLPAWVGRLASGAPLSPVPSRSARSGAVRFLSPLRGGGGCGREAWAWGVRLGPVCVPTSRLQQVVVAKCGGFPAPGWAGWRSVPRSRRCAVAPSP